MRFVVRSDEECLDEPENREIIDLWGEKMNLSTHFSNYGSG